MAKGFSQKEGVDYNETYSPTARLTTIRVLLNLTAQYEVCPKQLDIKTAFLNAKIDEHALSSFLINPGIENMPADILTKPLRKTKLMKFKGFLMNP